MLYHPEEYDFQPKMVNVYHKLKTYADKRAFVAEIDEEFQSCRDSLNEAVTIFQNNYREIKQYMGLMSRIREHDPDLVEYVAYAQVCAHRDIMFALASTFWD